MHDGHVSVCFKLFKHTEKYDKSDDFLNSQVFIYFVSSFLEKRKHSLLLHMG